MVQRDGGYAVLSDTLVDLRVDDHERPIEELRRIYGLHRRLFGLSPRDEWLPLEGELRTEVDERLARLGYDSLDDWAGVENLEERVDGDDDDRPSRPRSAAGGELVKTLRIDDIEGLPVLGTLMWQPVRRPLGITAFGINAYTATNAGDEVVEEHTEQTDEEAYVVIRGHATFTVDGEEIDAPWGTIVFLDDPNQRRHAIAKEAGTTVLAIGGRARHAPISSWEYIFPSLPARNAERLGHGARRSSRRRSPSGTFPAIRYHLACVEARAGNADRALEDLRERVRGAARLRRARREEDDFASIRDDPRFPQ